MVIAPKSPDERVAAHEPRRRVMNTSKKKKKHTNCSASRQRHACGEKRRIDCDQPDSSFASCAGLLPGRWNKALGSDDNPRPNHTLTPVHRTLTHTSSLSPEDLKLWGIFLPHLLRMTGRFTKRDPPGKQ